ncbi:MAG TPA: hypothetical protein VEX69_09805 [Candidatus Limnocylindria bacterium]|nr:hypothetical protein [Candidatus Limnocylindria bacterium]
MSSIGISSIVFGCAFGGALVGISLRAALPNHHLTAESKGVVNAGMGLVATLAALVLGLLIASAKGSYDAQGNELTEMSAKVVFLDRVLAHYGPETNEAREVLRSSVVRVLNQMWSKERTNPLGTEPGSAGGEVLADKIQELSPKDDAQRSIQTQALSIVMALGQTRWLMYEQSVNSISMPLLIVLTFWITALFISFGLFAPFNATAVASLFVSGLSVSGAIFLILELYSPYAGLIKVSRAPLLAALAQLGK